ncbi:MAG: hypothetical protein O2856_04955 [Planctomycetota bacterium]|nr:hypothetical protein [Planctomycetota bacterium]
MKLQSQSPARLPRLILDSLSGFRSDGSFVIDRKLCIQLCILVNVILSSSSLHAQANQVIKIVDKVWGFDGRVVGGQFMPLSIEIDNLGEESIEGIATLRSVAGMVRETGGTLVQPFFVGGHSRKWVHFYPYIAGMTTSWQFELRTETETFRFDAIDQPRSLLDSESLGMNDKNQSMIAVILDPPGGIAKIPTTVKHMPDEIFPPYFTATHGLYAMFLDHVPNWETPRQEAMLSWLKAGGRLHLLKDQNNQTLHFSGTMAALNEPFTEFHVGSGSVTRHEMQRGGLTKNLVDAARTPMGVSKADLEEYTQYQKQFSNGMGYGTSVTDDDELFAELRQLTQPDHMWILIFLLSVCYVGLIFPGCWILSRQRRLHFLITYGCIAGIATVFSLMFLFIGRRGYGESTSLHSLAIARAEDDTHSSLLQFTTLFVTSGNTYSVEDKDHQALLASGSSEESVDARITSGNTASFISRIPPYSSQAIRSRRRIETDNWNLAVTSLSQQGDELKDLTIAIGDKFPVDETTQCRVIHGRKLYRTQIDRSRGQISLAGGRELLFSYCAPRHFMGGGGPVLQTVEELEAKSDDRLEECFKRVLPHLVRRSLADDSVQNVAAFRLPEDRVRLLVYAPMLDSQHLSVNAELRRVGRVLYVRDLLLNAGGQDAEVAP